MLVAPSPIFSMSSLFFIEFCLRAAYPPDISQASNRAPWGFGCRWSSRGNAACNFINPSHSDKTSASKGAVSRERLAPLNVAADAVTSAYLPAMAADLHPTYSVRTSMAVPSICWLAAPSYSKGMHSVPLVLDTRTLVSYERPYDHDATSGLHRGGLTPACGSAHARNGQGSTRWYIS